MPALPSNPTTLTRHSTHVYSLFIKTAAYQTSHFGSNFTPVEQHIVKALTWLKQKTDTKAEFATTVAQLAISDLKHRFADEAVDIDTEALARMGLDDPEGIEQTVSAKLLSYTLQQTQLTAQMVVD